jgi:hypothetical protein
MPSQKVRCECGAMVVKKGLARHKKTKKHLKGAGLTDMIKSGINKVKDVFSVRDGYNNEAQKSIKDYGDWRIMKINVYRKPIEKALDMVLNLTSGGKWTEAKKAANFDTMFHLGMFLVINNNKGQFANLICEKNAVINIRRVSFDISKAGESVPVHVNKDLTLNAFLDNAQKHMGDKYFKYDAFQGNNCQVYVKSCLEANGFYNAKVGEFVYQPLDVVLKTLPKSTPFIAKAVTTLGGIWDKLIGNGKPHKGGRIVNVQSRSDDKLIPVDIDDEPTLADDEKLNTSNMYFDADGNPTSDKSKNAFHGPRLESMRRAYSSSHMTDAQKKGLEKTRDYNRKTDDVMEKARSDRRSEVKRNHDNPLKGEFWSGFADSFKKALPATISTLGSVISAIPGLQPFGLMATTAGHGLDSLLNGGALTVQSVKVKKTVPLDEANKHVKSLLKCKRDKKMTTFKSHYQFRNHPKTKFEGGSLVTKKLSKHVSVVVGKLKKA